MVDTVNPLEKLEACRKRYKDFCKKDKNEKHRVALLYKLAEELKSPAIPYFRARLLIKT